MSNQGIPMSAFLSAHDTKAQALALGFNLVGITRAEPSPFLDAYLRWAEAGMNGTMGYMTRPDRVARRRDLNVILPGARSLVVVGLDYGATLPETLLHDPARGRIASYAWGMDYHDVMLPKLHQLAEMMGGGRAYVDTGAILERSHAHSAGMGFIGKNTMLIHPRRGSTFFLGEILTDAEFDEYDSAARATMCGTCTRCLRACPTNAFPQPHVLDARRCISYLTIEHKGWIDRDLRPLMGNWVFGCDVCQDVCPFQRFNNRTVLDTGSQFSILSTQSQNTHVQAAELRTENRELRTIPPLSDLLTMNSDDFARVYAGTPVGRIGHERLVRNACVAAGNGGIGAHLPLLTRLLEDDSALVRGHAAWALRRIGGDDAQAAVAAAARREHDELAQAEMVS
jgi:epoxyqueuosine reductase